MPAALTATVKPSMPRALILSARVLAVSFSVTLTVYLVSPAEMPAVPSLSMFSSKLPSASAAPPMTVGSKVIAVFVAE
ncbi:hypothetical protein D3C87_1798840 [compost metagenome]